jgi:hypothetical protein
MHGGKPVIRLCLANVQRGRSMHLSGSQLITREYPVFVKVTEQHTKHSNYRLNSEQFLEMAPDELKRPHRASLR